jgi:hypothetical protein
MDGNVKDAWDVVAAFSMPVKVGWALWMAWGVAQLMTYRMGRVPVVDNGDFAAARAAHSFHENTSFTPRLVHASGEARAASTGQIVELEATGTMHEGAGAASSGRRRRRSPQAG